MYIKKIVDKTSLSVWTLSYYQNALAAPCMFVFTICNGELAGAMAHVWTPADICVVSVSCVAGLVMSWSSMNLRGLVRPFTKSLRLFTHTRTTRDCYLRLFVHTSRYTRTRREHYLWTVCPYITIYKTDTFFYIRRSAPPRSP